MRQLKFQAADFKLARPFGGDLLKKAKNRTARPLSTKKSMHLILRSDLAVGEWNFRTKRNSAIIGRAVELAARQFGVKVYRFANGGNHIHMLIKLGNRFAYAGFIRSITGTIALQISGAKKFAKLKAKFWTVRPFTRIVEWGRAFNIAKDYIYLNQLEAAGVMRYHPGRLREVVLHPFGRDG